MSEQLLFDFEISYLEWLCDKEAQILHDYETWLEEKAFFAWEKEFWESIINRLLHPLLYWRYQRRIEREWWDSIPY